MATKNLFTAESISTGGRSGSVQSPDRLLNLQLGNPLVVGLEKRGPSPELLFAGAYSACFYGAVVNAAEKLGTALSQPRVRVLVTLQENDEGEYKLAVELHAHLQGVESASVQRIMDAAHETCPYSRALRADASVRLIVDAS